MQYNQLPTPAAVVIGIVSGTGQAIGRAVMMATWLALIVGVMGGFGIGTSATTPADVDIAVEQHVTEAVQEYEAGEVERPVGIAGTVNQRLERIMPVRLNTGVSTGIRDGVAWLLGFTLRLALGTAAAIAPFVYAHQSIFAHPAVYYPITGALLVLAFVPFLWIIWRRLHELSEVPG